MNPETEAPPDTSQEKSEEEKLREEQDALAATQNLPPGTVPEKRPIASQTTDDSHEGVIHNRLKEVGELDNEPMGPEAYERAQSDAQRKKAAKDERYENLVVGDVVTVTKRGPHQGRNAVILSIRYADIEAKAVAQLGDPGESRFAEVENYTVRTRDGRVEEFAVDREDVELIRRADFGRTVT